MVGQYIRGGQTHGIVWQFHQLAYQFLLLRFVRLRGDHVPNGLVECVHLSRKPVSKLPLKGSWAHLLRRQIDCDAMQQPQDLVDKRLLLLRLLHDEMTSTFLRYFDERVARHILHTYVQTRDIQSTRSSRQRRVGQTFVCLMHEFEQLIDDRFEEFPVRFQESRVLADNVHDVRRDDSFVVFAPLDLAETQ